MDFMAVKLLYDYFKKMYLRIYKAILINDLVKNDNTFLKETGDKDLF